MRKIFVIAGNSLLRTSRDRKALMLMLLMPMILIGILGVALGPMMDEAKINPFTVYVVNADVDAKPALPPGVPATMAAALPTMNFGKVLAADVFQSDQVKRIIKSVATTDLEQAKAEVADGKAAAVVQIPATFTAEILAGRKGEIKVLTDPGHPLQGEIVSQVTGAFAEGLTANLLAERNATSKGPEEIAAQMQAAVKDVQAAAPKILEVAAGAKPVSAMQYYAAAMAIMFMLMTAMGRAANLIEERQNGTLSRMLVSPTSKAVVLAGQVLGTVAVIVTQFAILMVGTRLLFGVYWGEWLPALAVGVSFALAAAGIGIATAGILNDAKAADAAMGLVANIFAMLSGGMFPLYIFPEPLKMVARFIPNYWALQGFLDQMGGLGLAHLGTTVGILATIALAAGAVGTWRLAAE